MQQLHEGSAGSDVFEDPRLTGLEDGGAIKGNLGLTDSFALFFQFLRRTCESAAQVSCQPDQQECTGDERQAEKDQIPPVTCRQRLIGSLEFESLGLVTLAVDIAHLSTGECKFMRDRQTLRAEFTLLSRGQGSRWNLPQERVKGVEVGDELGI